MGSGIASHLANAGVSVLLLDVPSEHSDDRNAVVNRALRRMQRSQPPALMQPANADRIRLGNIDDDLDRIKEVDWIAEAVVERLEVKQTLYQRIDAVRRFGSMVSSNTSTIPIAQLTQRMTPTMRSDFCITHFFNPVRYMQLLELVRGVHTRDEVVDTLAEFCDQKLGKGVVHCKDTPGFLANRVGVYALQAGMTEAFDAGLTVEEADAIMGRPMGIPKTGVFGLYDLIGLDLMLDVSASMVKLLPFDDPFHRVANGIQVTAGLVADGRTGNKSGAGFYRTVSGSDGRLIREVIDLNTGKYRRLKPVTLADNANHPLDLRGLVAGDDRYSGFARRVLSRVLAYAAGLIPEVAEDPKPIDEAMKLGYSWRYGPFEMIDQLGVKWFKECLLREGIAVPGYIKHGGDRSLYQAADRVRVLNYRQEYTEFRCPPGVIRLEDIRRLTAPRRRTAAASLWDIGEEVGCIEFHTKANVLDTEAMELLVEAIDYAEGRFKALVIYNDAPQFSVGFNLNFVLECIQQRRWSRLDQALDTFQNACRHARQAPFPVVAAPAGLALGGGFEVVLGADAVQAHANSTLGLVETLVGLIPAGGGCTQMLYRWSENTDDMSAAAGAVFSLLSNARTANSPQKAYEHRFLLARDRWTMSRDRLLAEARSRSLELADAYSPVAEPVLIAAGDDGRQTMLAILNEWEQQGILMPHDRVVGEILAFVLAGGEQTTAATLSEDQMLGLEREAFIMLAQTPETAARIEYMLTTGRSLRN